MSEQARTCEQLAICQSIGCQGCPYPYFPGGKPAWPDIERPRGGARGEPGMDRSGKGSEVDE